MLFKQLLRYIRVLPLILSVLLFIPNNVQAIASPPQPPRPFAQPIIITNDSGVYRYQPLLDRVPKLILGGQGMAYAHMSPDQSSIVYAQTLANGASQLFKMSANGTNIQQLTFPDARGSINSLPQWSPNGKQIVYVDKTRNQDNAAYSNIYSMRADGSEQRNLTNVIIRPGYFYPLGYGRPAYPAFEADGAHILFMNCCTVGFTLSVIPKLGVAPSGGSGIQSFMGIAVNALSSAASPNGNLIAYNGLYGPQLNLYTIAQDGSDKKLLVEGVGITPAWSPDGRQLIFVQNNVIYSMAPDGGKPTKLFDMPGLINSIGWN